MGKIILMGYMGSGKSTVGAVLAKKKQVNHFDLDKLIETKTNLSIADIFEQKGEIYFRKTEHEVLKEVLHKNDEMVVSVGGGTPCYSNNLALLESEKAITIYIKASIDILYNRLLHEKSSRPLVANKSEEEFKEFIAKHLFERSFYYNQATHTITVDNKTPDEIANEIQSLLA